MDPYHSQRGMLAPLALAVLLIAAALIGAAVAARTAPVAAPTPEPSASPSLPPSVPPSASPEVPGEGSRGGTSTGIASAAPVAEFSLAGYMHAVRTGKLVALMYSSAGCAGCEEAFAAFQDAVGGIADGRLAAFRVDYGDPATDREEEAAAGTFGIAAPHTLAVVRNGTLATKEDVSGWDAARFQAAIAGFLR